MRQQFMILLPVFFITLMIPGCQTWEEIDVRGSWFLVFDHLDDEWEGFTITLHFNGTSEEGDITSDNNFAGTYTVDGTHIYFMVQSQEIVGGTNDIVYATYQCTGHTFSGKMSGDFQYTKAMDAQIIYIGIGKWEATR